MQLIGNCSTQEALLPRRSGQPMGSCSTHGISSPLPNGFRVLQAADIVEDLIDLDLDEAEAEAARAWGAINDRLSPTSSCALGSPVRSYAAANSPTPLFVLPLAAKAHD